MDAPSIAKIRAALGCAAHEQLPALIARYEPDSRAGVVLAVAQARRRLVRDLEESARLIALAEAECRMVDAGVALVAGVDEVGRGALAGPVSAGACIFERDVMIPGLDDSKRLSPVMRERLSGEITAVAIACSVGHAEPGEIDAIGIAAATVLAMRRALDALGVTPDHVLIDGRPVDVGRPSTAIVRGDSTVRAIAAAAILAKVARDALMVELDAVHPGYGLAGNKGYGSADHIAALAEMGPSPIHRRSFSPCSQSTLF
jgi:ribonuclease HII